MRSFVLVALTTNFLMGCEGIGSNGGGSKLDNPYDCVGGIADEISFGLSSAPSRVKATYTRYSGTNPGIAWVIDECGTRPVNFNRYDNKMYVWFGDWGMHAPERFDLRVVRCSDGHVILNRLNTVPPPGIAGVFCATAEYTDNAQ